MAMTAARSIGTAARSIGTAATTMGRAARRGAAWMLVPVLLPGALLPVALPAAARAEALDESAGAAAQAEPRVAIAIARAAHVDPRTGPAIEILASRPLPPAATGGPLAPARPAGMPLAAAVITSGYGYRVNPVTGQWAMHRGVDLAAPAGTPVMATADGIVGQAGWAGSYGILVTVRHGNGAETRYAHLSALAVIAGAKVRKGEVIGYVGSTGRSTGPHLHYEVRQGPNALDPVPGLGQ